MFPCAAYKLLDKFGRHFLRDLCLNFYELTIMPFRIAIHITLVLLDTFFVMRGMTEQEIDVGVMERK